ncbi:hypothetical protein EDD86DRAFT_250552 [Gorgonomyces haynaldii]|nr:hypothetical protein EDD86DRAFT_250552 [Gorgonomyces haynaldii]
MTELKRKLDDVEEESVQKRVAEDQSKSPTKGSPSKTVSSPGKSVSSPGKSVSAAKETDSAAKSDKTDSDKTVGSPKKSDDIAGSPKKSDDKVASPKKTDKTEPSEKIFGIKQSQLGSFNSSGDKQSPFAFKYASSFTSFATASPMKSSFATMLKQKEDEEEEEEGLDVSVVKLQPRPPPPPAENREEDEDTIKSMRCKLFSWEDENWKERGAVMRADVVFKVILNIRVISDTPLTHRNEKYLEIFKNQEEALEFHQALQKIKA